MKAKERLYLTSDGKALVREGDPKGAFLYVAPGDEIPDSAVERFGLVDGTLPDRAKGRASKEDGGGGNKERSPGENKGGKVKTPVDPSSLTSINGIGPATAKAFAAAGIADVAALAGIDPAAPPTVEKLPPAFDWAAVVAAAKAASGTAEA